MDWIRENKVLGTIVVLIVAGALGLVALLVMSYLKLSSSQEELEGINSNLAAIQRMPLYPSSENLEEKAKLVSEYEEAVNLLGTTLLTLQNEVPVTPMTETEFQADLKKRIAATKDKASKSPVKPGGMSLPPGEFDFGFSYTGTLPRNAEAATALGDYLAGVDAVACLMIDAGVESIDSIQRSELAVEKGVPPPKPEPVVRKSTKPGKKDKGKGAAPKKQVEVAKVVERRTLTITATMDQGSLQTILNQLASVKNMPHYTVLRLHRVENMKQEGPLKSAMVMPPAPTTVSEPAPEPPVPADAPVAVPATPPAVGTPAPAAPGPAPAGQKPAAPVVPAVVMPTSQPVVAPKPQSPDSQVVFGDEKLKVYFEIDLVRFVTPSAETAAN
jgi:hypothetical protein